MKSYSLQQAKSIIQKVCEMTGKGAFPTRESFIEYIDRNTHIAIQGYNPYGKIFLWNTASSHLYGYRESEAINQDIIELIIPPEMRAFARSAIATAQRTGRMPDPGFYDLLHCKGHFVTVYSGHLFFSWDDATMPEFYCIDLPIDSDALQTL